MSVEQLIKTIRGGVIGEGHSMQTPFGVRPLIYADYTASGRSLDFIENYIRNRVLPWYANTHTETSATGLQTTRLREDARELIKKSVKAGDDDLVIFCGSGATAAIHKFIDILNLRLPADLDDQYQFNSQIPEDQRPVVFIGPYEHHSNELPWRESIATLVTIGLMDDGCINVEELESQLQKYHDRSLKIGSFSAASNVTGLRSNCAQISNLLHKYGAISCWDYAAAAPYVDINMSGAQNAEGDSSQDALFISPHKFVGGPGTPGLLVIKKNLLSNRVPSVPGGGTVSWVSPVSHRYLDQGERREEGGTPAIVEAIRAGLVFQLKDAVGAQKIEKLERGYVSRALARWGSINNIDILGATDRPRISIVSLQIKSGGKVLHHGFVTALLNDLFGIQVRGGCSCAGPYGHGLLGIDAATSEAIEQTVATGCSVLKPGWVRLNFNYFISEETFEYLLKAIELVASDGWRMLGHYQFDGQRGVWSYQGQIAKPVARLSEINYNNGLFECPENPEEKMDSLEVYLQRAVHILTEAGSAEGNCGVELDDAAEGLRWFSLPKDLSADYQSC